MESGGFEGGSHENSAAAARAQELIDLANIDYQDIESFYYEESEDEQATE